MRQLTRREIEISNKAPSFENVLASQIFGPQSDGALAQRVHANIRRYLELREQWEYETGAKPRPDSYYDQEPTR